MKTQHLLSNVLLGAALLLLVGLLAVLLTTSALDESRNIKHLLAWTLGIMLTLAAAAIIRLDARTQRSRLPLQRIENLWENLSNTALYVTLMVIWVVYAVLNLILLHTTDVRYFETEGYITSFNLREAWEVANRPITVPYLYKALQNNATAIEIVQYALHIGGWTILAGALVLVLRTRLLQISGFVVILLFSISREIYFWNSMLLSESVSHSGMAACLGIGLVIFHFFMQPRAFSRRQQMAAASFLTLLLIGWSWTRDANSYILLTLAGLFIGASVLWWRPLMRTRLVFSVIVVVGCLASFALQSWHSNTGDKRWQLPFINVLGARILPDEDRTAFFVERGLPDEEGVMRYRGQRAWAYYPDHDMRQVAGDWITNDGRNVYAEFLLTHPGYSFLAPFRHWDQLLTYEYSLAFLNNVEDDNDVPLWQRVITCAVYPDDIGTCHVESVTPDQKPTYAAVFPLFLMGSTLLLVLVAFAAFGFDKRLLVVLALLVFAYVMGFISWHGDADSVERHSTQVNILWRLAVWFGLLFAIDWLVSNGDVSRSA